MTKPDDDGPKAHHTPGSQPSTRLGSDEPQTITAPTPPIAKGSNPRDRGDLADEKSRSERSSADDEPETRSEDD